MTREEGRVRALCVVMLSGERAPPDTGRLRYLDTWSVILGILAGVLAAVG